MNATKKESRKYSREELLALSEETKDRSPEWISRSLREQADGIHSEG